MEIWKYGIVLFCGIAMAQSCFLGLYWLAKTKLRWEARTFLGLLLLGLSLRIGKSIFYYLWTSVADDGVALGAAGLWLMGPAWWWYNRSLVGETGKHQALFHFLPLVLVFIGVLIRPDVAFMMYVVGTIHLLVYVFASFRVSLPDEGARGAYNRLRYCVLGIAGIFVFQHLGKRLLDNGMIAYVGGAFAASIILYLINYYLLTHQLVLAKVKSTSSKRPDADRQRLVVEGLLTLFEQQKIYRQQKLQLNEVAQLLEQPSYLVSKVINTHFGLRFNEFVNRFRVEAAKHYLSDLDRNPTVQEVAHAVGFSGTSSLYEAFKKETQQTPQGFRMQLKQQTEP